MKQRTPMYLALALALAALAAGGTGLLPAPAGAQAKVVVWNFPHISAPTYYHTVEAGAPAVALHEERRGQGGDGRAQHIGHDRERRHPPGGRQRESREGVHGGHQHAIAEEQYLRHREPGDDSLRRRMAHARGAQALGAGVPSQKGDALPIRAR
jgi:hypothetical protein